MSEPLLQLDKVDFTYGSGHIVLSACSFQLDRGERVALVGANGSGKTTLLKLIVGLVHPTAGRVIVLGQTRERESQFVEVRQRVGFLFQDADDQLFCPTVAEDVAFGPLNMGKPRSEVRDIVAGTLESLGLTGYEHRITYKLSGGEKRLVALATVLAMEPEVLLLDEPTAGLDPSSTRRVVDVLSALPQAMIIVSHDPGLLECLATRWLRLVDGGLLPTAEKAAVGRS